MESGTHSTPMGSHHLIVATIKRIPGKNLKLRRGFVVFYHPYIFSWCYLNTIAKVIYFWRRNIMIIIKSFTFLNISNRWYYSKELGWVASLLNNTYDKIIFLIFSIWIVFRLTKGNPRQQHGKYGKSPKFISTWTGC